MAASTALRPQTIVPREISLLESALRAVGSLQAGSAASAWLSPAPK
jgi:hypothetical protein